MKRKGNVFAKKALQKKLKGKDQVQIIPVETNEVESDQESNEFVEDENNFDTTVQDLPDDVVEDDYEQESNHYIDPSDDEDEDDNMGVDEDDEKAPRDIKMMKMISETDAEFKQDKRAKFKPPTREELHELREAELLFKSNLFRMQVDELLKEVKVNTAKTTIVENALLNLKDTLDSIPSQKVEVPEKKNARYQDIILQHHDTTKLGFQFEKPTSVDVVGSFLLRTVAKPVLNVDVTFEMPNSIFHIDDYLNHIYHDKRALYLRVLAEHLSKTDFFSKVAFSTFRGDVTKPILILHPQKNENGTLTKFVIRLIPTFSRSVFRIRRLLPGRCSNPKQGVPEESQPVTPHYNNSITEDIMFKDHLKLAHAVITDCPLLVDTVLLFKVWLRQREMYKYSDTFNGFLATMLLVHLYQQKKITKSMSSYQMFKIALQYIVSWQPIFMNTAQGWVQLTEEEQEAYKSGYDVVFVDPSGICNLTSRVTKNAWEDLKHEAEMSLQHLNDATAAGFDALFIQHVSFNLKYDTFVRVEDIPSAPEGNVEASNKIADIGDRQYQIRRLEDILYRGLGDRILQLRIACNTDKEWDLNTKRKLNKEPVLVGFVLNSLRAKSLLDSGPSPEETNEADAYRKLWGNKAELRRFKDGRILLAVVWDVPEGQKHKIITKSITFLLYRHLAISHRSLYFVNDQLDTLIYSPEHGYTDRTAQLAAIVDQLTKIMRYDLKGVPLSITLVQGTDPELRYTSVFPHQSTSVTTALTPQKYMKPLKLIIQFESSGSWPNELDAIRNIKTAFLLQISKSLENHDISSQVTETHMLINYFDFLFQVEIYYHKEMTLLEQNNLLLAKALQLEYERKTIYHSTVKSFYQRFPTFGPTVRLVKRWMASHMFMRHFTEESIELLVCSLFSKSAPYLPPNNPQIGFFRFLNFMSTFDFESFPVIVDFDGQFSSEDLNEIMENFQKIRGENKERFLYLVYPQDKDSVYWTKEKPTKQILKRVIAFAQVSEKVLKDQFEFSTNSFESRDLSWKSIFKTPLNDYNLLIKLKHIPHYEQNILFSIDSVSRQKIVEKIKKPKGFKNISNSELIVGVNPVERYIAEMEARFHGRAMFFYDNYGGDCIGVVWKPSGFEVKPFSVADSLGSKPAAKDKVVDKKKKNKLHVIPNVEQIVEEMREMGEGLVEDITVVRPPPS